MRQRIITATLKFSVPYSHKKFGSVGEAEAKIIAAKDALEKALGGPVDDFSTQHRVRNGEEHAVAEENAEKLHRILTQAEMQAAVNNDGLDIPAHMRRK